MSNIIYLKRNTALDTINTFGYDVIYEIDNDIKAFEFKIESKDDDPGSLHSITSTGNCESEHFLRNLNTSTGKIMGLENPFGVLSGCIPASSHDNPCILIQLLFTKEFIKKPSITGIHISDPNKSPITTTYGGSIITLPDSITSKTPNVSGHYEFELYSAIWDLTGTKQYADDLFQNPTTSLVNWNSVGTYNIQWTNTDAQSPSVTTTKSITISVVDTTPVIISAVSISSDNNGYLNWVKEGSTVILTFTANEKIKTPVVTFDIIHDDTNKTTYSGDSITYQNTTISSGNEDDTWKASFVVNSENTGSVEFSLTCTDFQNNNNTANATTTTDESYLNYDNIPPSVVSFTIANAQLKKGENALVTLIFSNPVKNFNSDYDISVLNNVGLLSQMTPLDDGVTWTGTFTPTTNIEETSQQLILSTNWTDRAGNPGPSANMQSSFDIDTKTPSVVNFTLDKTALAINDTATVTLEFSESVNNFNSGQDISVSNDVGLLSQMTSTDGGITWTGTFTPTMDIDETDQILMLSDDWEDLAGNTGVTENSQSFNVDTSRPIVQSIVLSDLEGDLISVPSSYKLGDSIYLRVNFSQIVTVSDVNQPELVLWDDKEPVYAVYYSNTNSEYLLFKYIVNSDIDKDNLEVIGINNYTNILDGAGNHIVHPDNIIVVTSINIDGVAPSISSITPSWGNVLNETEMSNGGTVTVTMTGVEDYQNVTINLNSKDYVEDCIDNLTTFTISATDLSNLQDNENYTIIAYVSDSAENSASQVSYYFTVDIAAPSIEIETVSWEDNLNSHEKEKDQIVTLETSGVEHNVGNNITLSLVHGDVVIATWSEEVKSDNTTIEITNLSDLSFTSGLPYTLTADVSDSAGNQASQANHSFSVDLVQPYITSVTKDTGNFSSVIGSNEIYFYVVFNDTVNVTVTPLLYLNLTKNGLNKYATYDSINDDNNTLKFKYNVEFGDNIPNLNASTLSLNGGTIKDDNNNNADLSSLFNNDTTNITSIDTTLLELNYFTFTDLTNIGDYRTNNHLVGFKFTSNKGGDKDSVSVSGIDLEENTNITYNTVNDVWEGIFDTKVTSGESTIENVIITLTDSHGNSNTLNVPSFTVDKILPGLSSEINIPNRTSDSTPEYTFKSTKAGSISYDGATSSIDSIQENTNTKIVFNELTDGIYTNIKITVTDDVGNESTLAVPTFTVDTRHPEITITCTCFESSGITSKSNNIAKEGDVVQLYITSNEDISKPVVKFEIGGTEVHEDRVSITGSNTVYAAQFTVTSNDTSGNITVSVTVADEAEPNANTFTKNAYTGDTARVDTNPPIITGISSSQISLNDYYNSIVTVIFTCNKSNTTFNEDDLELTNCSYIEGSFSTNDDGITYNANLQPSSNGLCSVKVSSGKFSDEAGNSNINPSSSGPIEFKWYHDHVSPVITIESSNVTMEGHYNNSVEFTFECEDEDITLVDNSKITVTNGSFSTSISKVNGIYSGIVTPEFNTCTCTVTVNYGAFRDSAGNTNTTVSTFSWNHDIVLPVLNNIGNISESILNALITPTNDNTPSYVFFCTKNDCTINPSDYSITSTDIEPIDDIFKYTITFEELDDSNSPYNLSFTVTDLFGNTSSDDNTLYIHEFVVDTLAPVIIETKITSSNINSPYIAKANDIITLSIKTNEPVNSVIVQFKIGQKILGQFPAQNVSHENKDTFLASYAIRTDDGEGIAGIHVSLSDEANNQSETTVITSGSVLIDTKSPILTEKTKIPEYTNNNSPSYVFNTDKNGLINYNGQYGDITYAYSSVENTITFNDLDDGTYSDISFSIRDLAGNESNLLSVPTFTVATQNPILSQGLGIADISKLTTPTFSFNSNSIGTIRSSLSFPDNQTHCIVGQNSITFDALPDGFYDYEWVEVKDLAGNVSDRLNISSFIIDTTLPKLSITTHVPSHTSNTTPTFTFRSDKEALSISLNSNYTFSKEELSDNRYKITLTNLDTDNTYNKGDIQITVTDALGNTSDPLLLNKFKIDTTHPNIESDNTKVTSNNGYNSDFAVSGRKVELIIKTNEPINAITADDIIFYADNVELTDTINIESSDNQTLHKAYFNVNSYGISTNNGLISVQYTITDLAGNKSILNALHSTVTVDTDKPILYHANLSTGDGKIPLYTNNTSPEYTFHSSEPGTIQLYNNSIYIDNYTLSQRDSQGNYTVTLQELSQGKYDNIEIILTDIAGNDSKTWTIPTFNVDIDDPSLISGTSTMTSSSESNWAKKDDVITIKLSANEEIIAFQAFIQCGVTTLTDDRITYTVGSHNPTATFTVDNENGIVSVTKIIMTDRAYNRITINDVPFNSSITVDTLKPKLTEDTAISTITNNPTYKFNSTKSGIISLNNDYTFSQSNTSRDTDGNYTILLTNLEDGIYDDIEITVTDSAGNISESLQIKSFELDRQNADFVNDVVLSTDNSSGQYARTNDTIFVEFDTNEEINTPSVVFKIGTTSINGNTVVRTDDNSGKKWKSSFTVLDSHPSLDVTVDISLTDLASNNVIKTSAVTSGLVTINNVYPTITLKNYGNTNQVDVSLELGLKYFEYGVNTASHDVSRSYSEHFSADVLNTYVLNVLGNHVVRYSSTSNSGNTTTEERYVTVEDNTPPIITIHNYGNSGQTDVTLERYSEYTEYGATASEIEGATVYKWNDTTFPYVNISSNLNMNEVGSYDITYEAKDQDDNTISMKRTVEVVDTIKPIIILNGSEFQTYKLNDTYDEKGAKIRNNPYEQLQDTLDGNYLLIDKSNLDMTTKGFYRVYYNLAPDNGGNVADTVVRYVAVGYNEESNSSTNDNDINKDGDVDLFDIMDLIEIVKKQNS